MSSIAFYALLFDHFQFFHRYVCFDLDYVRPTCFIFHPLVLILLTLLSNNVSRKVAQWTWPKYESCCLVMLPFSNILCLTFLRIILFVTNDIHTMCSICLQHHTSKALISFYLPEQPAFSRECGNRKNDCWIFRPSLRCWHLCFFPDYKI